MTAAVLPRERSAHLALRDTVEAYGEAVTRELYGWFDVLNRAFFAGELGAPMILISPPSSPRALGDFIARDVHGLESRIRIAPSTFKLGMREAVTTLLHEMVHAWAQEIRGEPEAGYKGHGPVFTAKCNEIGAVVGWSRVYVKGRGGPDSNLWPYVVEKPIKPAKVVEPEPDGEPVEPEPDGEPVEPEPDGEELAQLRAELAVVRGQLVTERGLSSEYREQLTHAHGVIQSERRETLALRRRITARVLAVREELAELRAKGVTSGGGPNRLRFLLSELGALEETT